MKKYWMFALMLLLPSLVVGQVTRSGGGVGSTNADSLKTIPIEDTAGNIADNDVPTFDEASGTMKWEAPPGAGGGTADSIGVDTNGDGTIDAYLYSTAGAMAMFRESSGMILNTDTDTLYFETVLGPTVAANELASAIYGDSGDVWVYEPGAAEFYARGIDELAVLADSTDTLSGDLTILSGKLIFKQTDGNDIEGVSKVTSDTVVAVMLITGDTISVGTILSIGGKNFDKLDGEGLTTSGDDLTVIADIRNHTLDSAEVIIIIADSTLRINDFILYGGGAVLAEYDTTDVPADGDQLTWNTAGPTIDWQPAGGGA
jgi:hypothetical protein